MTERCQDVPACGFAFASGGANAKPQAGNLPFVILSREGPMSEPETADKPKTTWPVLDAQERRVLGVLVEKSKTTPDSYPMSLNALVAGCNQKSNREPIMDLEDVEVEDTLSRLQKKGLVVRVTLTSSRVD